MNDHRLFTMSNKIALFLLCMLFLVGCAQKENQIKHSEENNQESQIEILNNFYLTKRPSFHSPSISQSYMAFHSFHLPYALLLRPSLRIQALGNAV